MAHAVEQSDPPPITFIMSPLTPMAQSDTVMAELPELPRLVQRPLPARPEIFIEEYRRLYSPQENQEYRTFRDTVRFEPSVDDSDLPMDSTLPHDVAALTKEQKLAAIRSPFRNGMEYEDVYAILGEILCKKGLLSWSHRTGEPTSLFNCLSA